MRKTLWYLGELALAIGFMLSAALLVSVGIYSVLWLLADILH